MCMCKYVYRAVAAFSYHGTHTDGSNGPGLTSLPTVSVLAVSVSTVSVLAVSVSTVSVSTVSCFERCFRRENAPLVFPLIRVRPPQICGGRTANHICTYRETKRERKGWALLLLTEGMGVPMCESIYRWTYLCTYIHIYMCLYMFIYIQIYAQQGS